MDLLSFRVLVTPTHSQEVAPHRYRTRVGERGVRYDRPLGTPLNEVLKRDGIDGATLTDPAASTATEQIPEGYSLVSRRHVEIGGRLEGVGWRGKRAQVLPLARVFHIQHANVVQGFTIKSSGYYQLGTIADGRGVASSNGEIPANRRPEFPFLVPLADATAVLVLAGIEPTNQHEPPLHDRHGKLFLGKPGKLAPLESSEVKLEDLASILIVALPSPVEELSAVDDTLGAVETVRRLAAVLPEDGEVHLNATIRLCTSVREK